jgi:4-hydroxybenzoate polyprenyltransferase
MLGFIRSMRPPQMFLKNGVVFAALIFAQKLRKPDAADSTFKVVLAYLVFAVLSGVVYIFNDILDVERDRKHPDKSKRPIASGSLPLGAAWVGCIVLAACGIAAAFALSVPFGAVAALYLVLNLAYSLHLKHVVIIDVMVISFGFLLRVIGGGVVISVEVSLWLMICTLLLALFLGFSKRRHELVILGDDAHEHRKILREYSPYFLDQIIAVVTSSTLVAYILYTMDHKVVTELSPYMFLTIPFVLYGIFRYLYLVHHRERGGSPTHVLLTDFPLLVNIGLWLATVLALLYTPVVARIIGFFS